MRIRHLTLSVALLLAATSASAATLVLDDFDSPAPAVRIDSATGNVAPMDIAAAETRRGLRAASYVDGPASYPVGDGAFVRGRRRGRPARPISICSIQQARPQTSGIFRIFRASNI